MRVAAVADFAALRRCLEESCEAKLRLPRAGTRTNVRASGVPVAMLCSLHLVALALNPSLVVVSQQVVRTTYDSLVVDLLVEGPALMGDEWRLAGLGSRPVVVKRMASRRRPATSAAMLALTPSTGGERSSWANVVRLGASASCVDVTPVPMEVSSSVLDVPAAAADATRSAPYTTPTTPVVAPAEPIALIPDDAEIPIRPRCLFS